MLTNTHTHIPPPPPTTTTKKHTKKTAAERETLFKRVICRLFHDQNGFTFDHKVTHRSVFENEPTVSADTHEHTYNTSSYSNLDSNPKPYDSEVRVMARSLHGPH